MKSMKALLLILLLAVSAQAQKLEDIKDWKLIKEMSGEIPNHPGLTTETHAAQIARGGDLIKLVIRADYPWGAPADIFRDHVPHGFDPSSISRIEVRIELHCATHVVIPPTNSAEIYQFNGKRYKSREQPFSVESWNIFFVYFCEEGTAPTVAPKLKP
jgi:hypothetical protein